MKRIIRPDPTVHISDLFDTIFHIRICDDLDRVILSSSDRVCANTDTIDESYYIQFSDAQLLELSDDIIHTFSDPRLLERIGKLDRDRLSAVQLEVLHDALSVQYIIDASDIRKLLDLIKKCTSVSYEGNHKKTNRFLIDSHGRLRYDDCLAILQALQVEDYVASTRSYNFNHLGNNLIIFQPNADWELSDGTIVCGLTIYVKLDIDETTRSAVALVSMHDTDIIDPKPYQSNT